MKKYSEQQLNEIALRAGEKRLMERMTRVIEIGRDQVCNNLDEENAAVIQYLCQNLIDSLKEG